MIEEKDIKSIILDLSPKGVRVTLLGIVQHFGKETKLTITDLLRILDIAKSYDERGKE